MLTNWRRHKWVKAIALLVVAVFLPEQVAWAIEYNPAILWQNGGVSVPAEIGANITAYPELFNKVVAESISRYLTPLANKRLSQLELKPGLLIAIPEGKKWTKDEIKSLVSWLKQPETETVPCSTYVLYNLLLAKNKEVKVEELSTLLILIDALSGNISPTNSFSILNSLYSLNKTAEYFGLELYPAKLSLNNSISSIDSLNSITPFIAHLSPNPEQNGHFVLVTKIDNEKVYYFYDKGNTFLPREKFLENFSGYILTSNLKPVAFNLIPEEEAKAVLGARERNGGRDNWNWGKIGTNIAISIVSAYVMGGLGNYARGGFAAGTFMSSFGGYGTLAVGYAGGMISSNLASAAGSLAYLTGGHQQTYQMFGSALGMGLSMYTGGGKNAGTGKGFAIGFTSGLVTQGINNYARRNNWVPEDTSKWQSNILGQVGGMFAQGLMEGLLDSPSNQQYKLNKQGAIANRAKNMNPQSAEYKKLMEGHKAAGEMGALKYAWLAGIVDNMPNLVSKIAGGMIEDYAKKRNWISESSPFSSMVGMGFGTIFGSAYSVAAGLNTYEQEDKAKANITFERARDEYLKKNPQDTGAKNADWKTIGQTDAFKDLYDIEFDKVTNKDIQKQILWEGVKTGVTEGVMSLATAGIGSWLSHSSIGKKWNLDENPFWRNYTAYMLSSFIQGAAFYGAGKISPTLTEGLSPDISLPKDPSFLQSILVSMGDAGDKYITDTLSFGSPWANTKRDFDKNPVTLWESYNYTSGLAMIGQNAASGTEEDPNHAKGFGVAMMEYLSDNLHYGARDLLQQAAINSNVFSGYKYDYANKIFGMPAMGYRQDSSNNIYTISNLNSPGYQKIIVFNPVIKNPMFENGRYEQTNTLQTNMAYSGSSANNIQQPNYYRQGYLDALAQRYNLPFDEMDKIKDVDELETKYKDKLDKQQMDNLKGSWQNMNKLYPQRSSSLQNTKASDLVNHSIMPQADGNLSGSSAALLNGITYLDGKFKIDNQDKIFDNFDQAMKYSINNNLSPIPEGYTFVQDGLNGTRILKNQEGEKVVQFHDGSIKNSYSLGDYLGGITGIGMTKAGAALYEARNPREEGGVNWWFRPLFSHEANGLDVNPGFGKNNFGATITNSLFGGGGTYSIGGRNYSANDLAGAIILRDFRGDGAGFSGQRDIQFTFKTPQAVAETNITANHMFILGANYQQKPYQALFGSKDGGIIGRGGVSVKWTPGLEFKAYALAGAGADAGGVIAPKISPSLLSALRGLGYDQEDITLTKSGDNFYETGKNLLAGFDVAPTALAKFFGYSSTQIKENLELGQGTEAELGRVANFPKELKSIVSVSGGLDPAMTPHQEYTFHPGSKVWYDATKQTTNYKGAVDLHLKAQNWHVGIELISSKVTGEILKGTTLLKVANPDFTINYRSKDAKSIAGIESVKFTDGSGREILADTKVEKFISGILGPELFSLSDQKLELGQKPGQGLMLRLQDGQALGVLPQQIYEVLPHLEHSQIIRSAENLTSSASSPFTGKAMINLEGDYAKVTGGAGGLEMPFNATKGNASLGIGEGLRSAALNGSRIPIVGELHMNHGLFAVKDGEVVQTNLIEVKPGYTNYLFARDGFGKVPEIGRFQNEGETQFRLGWYNSQNVKGIEFLTEDLTGRSVAVESSPDNKGNWREVKNIILGTDAVFKTVRNFEIEQASFAPKYIENRAKIWSGYASGIREHLETFQYKSMIPGSEATINLKNFALDENGYITASGSGDEITSQFTAQHDRTQEYRGVLDKNISPFQDKTSLVPSREVEVKNLPGDISSVSAKAKDQLIRFVPLAEGKYGAMSLHYQSPALTQEMIASGMGAAGAKAGDAWTVQGNIQNQGSKSFSKGEHTQYGIEKQGAGFLYNIDANNNFHINGYFNSPDSLATMSALKIQKDVLGTPSTPGDFWVSYEQGKMLSLDNTMKLGLLPQKIEEIGGDHVLSAGVLELNRGLKFNLGFDKGTTSEPSFDLAGTQIKNSAEFTPFGGGFLPNDVARIKPLQVIIGPLVETAPQSGIFRIQQQTIEPGIYVGKGEDHTKAELRAKFITDAAGMAELRWNKYGGQEGGLGIGLQTLDGKRVPLGVLYPEHGPAGVGGADKVAGMEIKKPGIDGRIVSNSYGQTEWGGQKLDIHDFKGRFEIYAGPMANDQISTGQSQAYLPALGTVAGSRIALGENAQGKSVVLTSGQKTHYSDLVSWQMKDWHPKNEIKAGWDIAPTTEGGITTIIKKDTQISTAYNSVHFSGTQGTHTTYAIKDMNLNLDRFYTEDNKFKPDLKFDSGKAFIKGLDIDKKFYTREHAAGAYFDEKAGQIHFLIQENNEQKPLYVELDMRALPKTGAKLPGSEVESAGSIENRSHLKHFASVPGAEYSTLATGTIDILSNLSYSAPQELNTQSLAFAPGARHEFFEIPGSVIEHKGSSPFSAKDYFSGPMLTMPSVVFPGESRYGTIETLGIYEGVGAYMDAARKSGKYYQLKFSDENSLDLRQGQMKFSDQGNMIFGMNSKEQKTQMFYDIQTPIDYKYYSNGYVDAEGKGASLAASTASVFGKGKLDVTTLGTLEGESKNGKLPLKGFVPGQYTTNKGSEVEMWANTYGGPKGKTELEHLRSSVYLFRVGEKQGESQPFTILATPQAGKGMFSGKEIAGGAYVPDLQIMSVHKSQGGSEQPLNHSNFRAVKIGEDTISLAAIYASDKTGGLYGSRVVSSDNYSSVLKIEPRYEFSLQEDLKTFKPNFEGRGAEFELHVPAGTIVNHFRGNKDTLIYPLGTFKEGVTLPKLTSKYEDASFSSGGEHRGIDINVSYWKDRKPSTSPEITYLKGNYIRKERYTDSLGRPLSMIFQGNANGNFSNGGESKFIVLDHVLTNKQNQWAKGNDVYEHFLQHPADAPTGSKSSETWFSRLLKSADARAEQRAVDNWLVDGQKIDAAKLLNERGEDKNRRSVGMGNWDNNDTYGIIEKEGKVYAIDVQDGPLGYVGWEIESMARRQMQGWKDGDSWDSFESNPKYQALARLAEEYIAADRDYRVSASIHVATAPLYITGIGGFVARVVVGQGFKQLLIFGAKQGISKELRNQAIKQGIKEGIWAGTKWGTFTLATGNVIATGRHLANGEGLIDSVKNGVKDIGGWGQLGLFASGFVPGGAAKFTTSLGKTTDSALLSFMGNSMNWAPWQTLVLNSMSILETGKVASFEDNLKAGLKGTLYGMAFNTAIPVVASRLAVMGQSNSRIISAIPRIGRGLNQPFEALKITANRGANFIGRHTLRIGLGGMAGIGLSSISSYINEGKGLTRGEKWAAFTRGAIWGEMIGYALSPNGIKYLQNISKSIQEYGSVSSKTFDALYSASRHGAITWPTVGATMSAASPLFDTVLVAIERKGNKSAGLPLDRLAPRDGSVWGFEFRDFLGSDGKPLKTFFRQAVGQTVAGRPVYAPAFFSERVENITYTGDHIFLLAQLDAKWGDKHPLTGYKGFLPSILGGQVVPSAITSLREGLYMGPLVGFAGNKPAPEINRIASIGSLWRVAGAQPYGRVMLLTQPAFYRALGQRIIGKEVNLSNLAERVMPTAKGGLNRIAAFMQRQGGKALAEGEEAAAVGSRLGGVSNWLKEKGIFVVREAAKIPGLVTMAGKVALIDKALEAPDIIGRSIDMKDAINAGTDVTQIRPENFSIRYGGFGQGERSFLSWSILFATGRQVKSASHEAMRRGNEAFVKNDTLNAQKHYTESLSLDPRNPELHYNLGTVYRQQGNERDAIRSFGAAERYANKTGNREIAENARLSRLVTQHDAGVKYFEAGNIEKALNKFKYVSQRDANGEIGKLAKENQGIAHLALGERSIKQGLKEQSEMGLKDVTSQPVGSGARDFAQPQKLPELTDRSDDNALNSHLKTAKEHLEQALSLIPIKTKNGEINRDYYHALGLMGFALEGMNERMESMQYYLRAKIYASKAKDADYSNAMRNYHRNVAAADFYDKGRDTFLSAQGKETGLSKILENQAHEYFKLSSRLTPTAESLHALSLTNRKLGDIATEINSLVSAKKLAKQSGDIELSKGIEKRLKSIDAEVISKNIKDSYQKKGNLESQIKEKNDELTGLKNKRREERGQLRRLEMFSQNREALGKITRFKNYINSRLPDTTLPGTAKSYFNKIITGIKSGLDKAEIGLNNQLNKAEAFAKKMADSRKDSKFWNNLSNRLEQRHKVELRLNDRKEKIDTLSSQIKQLENDANKLRSQQVDSNQSIRAGIGELINRRANKVINDLVSKGNLPQLKGEFQRQINKLAKPTLDTGSEKLKGLAQGHAAREAKIADNTRRLADLEGRLKSMPSE
ncbi:MAG: cysteine peptidase family C39 domain-containing protein, partial [Candidatus Omnitrophota bacterium]|nr:cysteine peptidase family C39 domain-containing protein [Candidatus Omnitrophota bacterium]